MQDDMNRMHRLFRESYSLKARAECVAGTAYIAHTSQRCRRGAGE
jgi:hypothetical protein